MENLNVLVLTRKCEVVLAAIGVGVFPVGVEDDGARLGGQLEEVLTIAVKTLTKVVQVPRSRFSD